MKWKIKIIRVVLIIILIVTMGIIYVYDPFSNGNNGPLNLSCPCYADTGLFRIDPETIVASLDEGRTEVFFPNPRSLDNRFDGPIIYNEPVEWNQADNLKIVNALNTYVWKDALDDWRLSYMFFDVACQDHLYGLPGGRFRYFKTVFENGKLIDIRREVEIHPEYSFVAWGGGAKFPHPLQGRESIDLSKLKVTAEDAIRIAEANGGREARLSVQNKCNITLSLTLEGIKAGWWVDYGFPPDFDILINPYTGEIIE